VILRHTFNEKLGGEHALVSLLHGHMPVQCAARVEARFDGAEAVLALFIGDDLAVPLEAWVAFLATLHTVAVNVASIVIRLPEFDEGTADRFAIGIEKASAKFCHRAHSLGGSPLDLQKVIV